MLIQSINPYTQNTLENLTSFSDKEISNKLYKAKNAADKWRKTTIKYRKTLMLNVATQLLESTDILAKTISQEMGKTITEAKAEIKKCAWVCEHYANDTEVLLHKEAIATDANYSYIRYDPLGTILGIMPWNFPFWQIFRFAAPTLMAGNNILLKHASNVQLCAHAIENIFEKAGFPDGVFQNLVIPSDKVKNIIKSDVVKAVSFTGSEEAGKKVAETAGKYLKKCVLELGGSNAFIVLEDADIDKAIEVAIKARFQNAGQSCIAAKRFLIHKNVSKKFMDGLLRKMKELKKGNPLDPETTIAPLANKEQVQLVYDQVRLSLQEGAELVYGEEPSGTFYPPALITNVKPGMPLFDEEVFGPVVPITIIENEQEAVQLTNMSKYGLGVSLFTNDLKKAEKMAAEFDDGAVFINAMVKSDPRLPFGGTKNSGYGRELAINGIREFVNVKTVYIDQLHEIKMKKNKNVVISTGNT